MWSRILLFLGLLLSAVSAEKLNIWIVPHSHDDTGWLRTIDEYYVYEVQYILDSVVEALTLNPERKFIEVEMAFFSRWWNEQNEERKTQTRKLVENGQLEFINGGWCMNDEATTIYYAIIDQMTLGHEFLSREFGDSGKPTIGWHVDPFGHSNAMPTLYNWVGFDAFYINRIDYRLKNELKASQDLEFIWNGSQTLGEKVSMWIHMMDSNYCTPNRFNWEHGVTQDLPDGDGPPPVVIDPPSWAFESNALERAQEYVDMARDRAKGYKTNNILMPFGCDFTFQNANMMFKNMDRLIETINKYSDQLDATARYTTLSDYAAFVKATNTSWITRQEDFYPYADNSASYWTGYFSSRPLLKTTSRKAHSILRNADFLYSLVKAHYSVTNMNAWESLNKLRAPEAVVQHHDGVTGTFRRLVGDNYLTLLNDGIAAGGEVISEMLGQFVSDGAFNPGFTSDLAYLEQELAKGSKVPVVLFNSLPYSRKFYANITLSTSDVSVTNSLGQIVNFQVNPKLENQLFTLLFLVELPPLGFSTYYVTSAPNTANLGKVSTITNDVVIENEHLALSFNGTTGLLATHLNKRTQKQTTLNQNYLSYRSYNTHQASGAYVFRPVAAASPVASTISARLIDGPFIQEVQQVYVAGSISQTIRVFKGLSSLEGGFAEIHATVGSLRADQEVIVRFSTSIQSGTELLSDNNGFELQKRTTLPNGRPDDLDAGIKIAGNYYPAVSRAAIRDSREDNQLIVATQSTHGVASLASGQLEIMLHRHCSTDDARGMSEALDDISTYTAILRFGVETNDEATRFQQRSTKELSFPPSLSFGNPLLTTQWARSSHQFLASSFPENLALISLNPRDGEAGEVALRLFNPFEAGSHSSLASPVTVNLLTLFKELSVTAAEERTLTLLHPQPLQPSDWSNILLNPMEIRTFVVQIEHAL